MTSSKADSPFVPNPLWQRPEGVFAPQLPESEEAPFRPLGLAACLRATFEAPAQVPQDEPGSAPEGAPEEALLPQDTEALQALRLEAEEGGYQRGLREGLARGHAQGLAEGEAQGREAAYAEGLAAGEAMAREAQGEVLALLETIAAALNAQAQPLAEQLGAFRRLTLHLTETVLRRTLDAGEDLLTPLLERVLEELDDQHAGEVSVALNPQDYEALASALGARFKALSFFCDEQVPRASLSLRSGATAIDDFLAQRLETLAREWLGESKGWAPERLGTPLVPKARDLDEVTDGEWAPLDPPEGPEDDA